MCRVDYLTSSMTKSASHPHIKKVKQKQFKLQLLRSGNGDFTPDRVKQNCNRNGYSAYSMLVKILSD